MSTPQTYTIQSDGIYVSPDGKKSFQFDQGTVVPMSLAIEFGLPGAGYDPVPVFDSAEIAAIEALAGGGGGGVTFPMAEGVWYDQSFGMATVDQSGVTFGADWFAGTVFMVPTACTITKIGVLPSEAPSAAADVLIAVYELGEDVSPTNRVGSAVTIEVPDTWSEGIVEVVASIELTAGWHFIGGTSDVTVTVDGVSAFEVGQGLLGFLAGTGRCIAWEGEVIGALPSTLAEATLQKVPTAPRILFQITHD